jgi:hypothetical protein
MRVCGDCAHIAPLEGERASAGVCYGEPPKLMLLPAQAPLGSRLAQAAGQGMRMVLQPMRPSVILSDKACALWAKA